MNIIDWPGYMDGAIPADNPEILRIFRADDGNIYIATLENEIYNVHPRVKEAGAGNAHVEYLAGAYPIRWKLDDYEIKALRETGA